MQHGRGLKDLCKEWCVRIFLLLPEQLMEEVKDSF